jgi:catechol 2,3-dioxygenase-like lactoylglutathione lyase family enzyme
MGREPSTLASSCIAHFTLATRNIAKSAQFFERALGWMPISRPGNIGRAAAWLSIGPAQELHLIEVADFEPSPFEQEFGRHFAIFFPLSEFEALKTRLIIHGAELIDPERDTPFQRFFFRDPNGYVFEIIEADHAPEVQLIEPEI